MQCNIQSVLLYEFNGGVDYVECETKKRALLEYQLLEYPLLEYLPSRIPTFGGTSWNIHYSWNFCRGRCPLCH